MSNAVLTLLAVDDDHDRRGTTIRCGRAAGIKDFLEAATEAEALAHIEHIERAIHLAVVDIHLTDSHEREGFRIMQVLRETHQGCKIICLTGAYDEGELGARAIRSGANDFISTAWPKVNWRELLEARLKLWSDVVQLQQKGGVEEGE